jgi:hypothetical protein
MKINKIFPLLNSLKNIAILSLPFILSAQNSFACSSCGSSATSPLVLYPGENFKMYFGLSQNFNFIDYKGASKTDKVINGSITTKDVATLAVGYRVTPNSFVSLTGSYIRNEGPNNPANLNEGIKEVYLMGDPLISGRYTLVNMEISEPSIPQVQIVGTYKPSIAKNMIDDGGSALDTTGNGFHQLSSGLDLWWGMPFIQFGGSQFVTYSFDKHPNYKVYSPKAQQDITADKRTRGLQFTTVLTAGHAFIEENFQLQAGLVLDHIGQEYSSFSDGEEHTSAAQQSNSVFTTINWNVTKLDLIRFSYSYGGAFEGSMGPYTNSSQTTSSMLLVAYERTFF